jgi:hypothetical protein
MLQLAKNLEKTNGKAENEAYQRIVKEHPHSPSAKDASARLKAIDGK